MVQRLQRFAARTYLISLLLGIGAVVLTAVHPRFSRDLGRLAAVIGLLMWWNFGSCMEVAVVHTLDNVRYDTIQIIFTVLTQFAAIFLVWEVARRAFRTGWFSRNDAGSP
jgi:predicted membrane protein